MSGSGPAVWGVVGWKNAGKTGLVERLVAEFATRGLRVSTVKHAHHAVEIDRPGTDSYRHRLAGASEVLLSTGARWALMHELRGAGEPGLDDLLALLSRCDLVLVEGFKREHHPKIEAHRPETGQGLLAAGDATVRAVASTGQPETDRPLFDLDATGRIADFIAAELAL